MNWEPNTERVAMADWSGGGREREPGACLLKVLTGRHAGAAMRLASRTYSIGRDEMCDFIFLDDGFACGRLTLDLTGEQPALTVPEGVNARIGSQTVGRSTVILGRYEPVTVGDTSFALGPADEPWPEGQAEPKPVPGMDPVSSAPDAVSAGAANHPSPGPDGVPPSNAHGLPPHEGSPSGLAPAPSVPLRHRVREPIKVAVVTFVLALVAFFLTRPDPDPGLPLRVLVQEVLDSLRLEEVEISGLKDSVRVSGFVPTERSRDTLLFRLARLPGQVVVSVSSLESLSLGVRNILEMYRMDLEVEVTPRGAVVLRGVYDDRGRLRGIMESLTQEVAGISAVEDSVLFTMDIHPFLTEILGDDMLGRKVSFETERGRLYGVLTKGKMEEKDLEAWQEIRARIQSRFRMKVMERWTDRLSPALLKSISASLELDTDLMAVGLGPLNYLTMKGGRRYFEGTRLKSGHIIKSIRKDRIVLKADGIEDIYFLHGGNR